MTAFKDIRRIKEAIASAKRSISRIRMHHLFAEKLRKHSLLSKARFLFSAYKFHMLKGFTAVGLLTSVSVGGHEYVKLNTNEVFHVFVNGQEAGMVDNPQVIDQYIIDRNAELEKSHPDVHMEVSKDGIVLQPEKAFKISADNEATLKRLDELVDPYATGTELIVDGKSVGIVKDEETAQQILEKIKNKYIPQKKNPGEVQVLSAESRDQETGAATLESVGFVQKIDLKERRISADQVMDPDELLDHLVTGSVQPTKYTVQEGDCVSCIATKFNISKQVIYDNNQWIQNDMIRVGDVLDLTVLQPVLTVKTVEKIVEKQEIQYETNYITDDTLRAGTIIPISPGKNGLKKVTYEVVKENGQVRSEELIDEEIIEPPVPAVAKKGTKIVLGEGTGKFAWPVLSARITSSFGMRWGKLHKGIDITSKNKNIMASDNGKVVAAGYKSDYGNYVIIDHQNGYRTLYGHMSKIYVSVGQIVEKGEKIGYMGSTGDSTGVHLHFEVQRGERPENPMKYLNR